ncbi:NADP-dependent oxidoreductase [Goodfellowiella coeruleoviolacea]|uniref:NADPH:quinone reductase n=1 Tax=Goodfellowiella coeruleoviolacea TaxID=334858 RepID=A0AAE3GKT6_9PSEU|nr:NADP-dependent oxidoreductase [Goodfellowiella coeruleoviolacea]MCP2169214.1 NADPH:quinone reductase [Goodfellowiella coeruleoviolacea]
MHAVVVRTFGGPEALEHVDVPLPEPGPGQLRIRVAASAVNPVDAATRSGELHRGGLMSGSGVFGIGWDAAGTVDAIGPGVTGFAPGQAVIGVSDRLDVPLGTYAEFVVLDADAVTAAPTTVPLTAAATLPLNGLTAWQALDRLALAEGQTVLVTGAAGAVGGFAVELAVARGLRVVALAGQRDADLVRGFGAEWFVPREDVPAGAGLGTAVRALVPGGVDGVLDAAVLGQPALDALRGGGAFASVIAGGAPIPLRGTRVAQVWIRADAAQLAGLVALVEAGRLTPRVADTHPLAEAVAAHQRLARGGLRGRLVLLP